MPLTVELFTELSNEYTRASNSLLPSLSTDISEEANLSPARNPLEAQARLLRSILDKIVSSPTVPLQGANESDELQSPLSETDQPVWQSAADWSISNGHEKDPQDPLTSMFSPSDDGIDTLQDVGFDLINSRFEDAGLLLWDENRIFSRSL
ncbi:hypothetical protein N7490_007254 [Penicillium lividum]|nr:hypothetical protein N7490_007254 [Penicillium lividum]